MKESEDSSALRAWLESLNPTERQQLGRHVNVSIPWNNRPLSLVRAAEGVGQVEVEPTDRMRLQLMQAFRRDWQKNRSMLSCPAKSGEERACFGCPDAQVLHCVIENEHLAVTQETVEMSTEFYKFMTPEDKARFEALLASTEPLRLNERWPTCPDMMSPPLNELPLSPGELAWLYYHYPTAARQIANRVIPGSGMEFNGRQVSYGSWMTLRNALERVDAILAGARALGMPVHLISQAPPPAAPPMPAAQAAPAEPPPPPSPKKPRGRAPAVSAAQPAAPPVAPEQAPAPVPPGTPVLAVDLTPLERRFDGLEQQLVNLTRAQGEGNVALGQALAQLSQAVVALGKEVAAIKAGLML